jgi:ubiquinone/menaquinone biosynthesis C-methylase UbiE/uncharacterized protein YndB with AHSA1/START domain
VTSRSTVLVATDLALPPSAAFDQVVDELVESFARTGLRFDPVPEGHVYEVDQVVGRVRVWTPAQRLVLDWSPAPWKPEVRVEVEVRVTPREHGAHVEVEQRGLGELFHDDPREWTGWVVSAVVAPFLRTLAPSNVGDWVTDRAARRPSGPNSRAVYADPVYHRPNFLLLLHRLDPGPSDRLLEVGCGGGAFLHEVLERGVHAVGIDHSPEMVRLATASNAAAVRDGRLRLIEADGSRLPVPDATFTIALSTGVFGFLPQPLETLREMRRGLQPGGRLAIFHGTKELVGTPACPEPMASRIRFYTDDELANLARAAGFVAVEVSHPELRKYAEEAGVPPEGLPLFDGNRGSQFLVGRRPERENSG